MGSQLLAQILTLSEFSNILLHLKQVDPQHGGEIEKALEGCLKETRQGLAEEGNDLNALRYWLYRQSTELKAHGSSYLSYSGTMAQREAALWKFSMTSVDQFFHLIFDALDEYFETKKTLMLAEVAEDSAWYTGIRDTVKKAGIGVNLAKNLLRKAAEQINHGDILSEEDVLNTRSVTERLLETHLSPDQVSQDVAQIMAEANKRYTQLWEQEIKTQAPDLEQLRAFAARQTPEAQPNVGFELGIAEQTFAVGLCGAVAGTIGLAAGWHTLTYAMIHVFPPAAVFAVVATIGVAVLNRDRAREQREQQIRDAVDNYHKMFLLQLDSGKIAALGDKTVREAMTEQSQRLVEDTLRQWEKAISGNVTVQHYRMLTAAVQAHLLLIDKYLEELADSSQDIIVREPIPSEDFHIVQQSADY